MPAPFIPPHHGSVLPPSLEQATVGNAMHPGILTCERRSTLKHVARMMSLHRVHCVAVMAPGPDHLGDSLVWGIISDLDLMRARISADEEMRAGDAAQQPVISVKPAMPLREAAEAMLEHSVSHLIVVHPEALLPIGIVSSLDVIETMAWGESEHGAP